MASQWKQVAARGSQPTIEEAADAVQYGGVLKLMDQGRWQGHWAAGWLYELTGKPLPSREGEPGLTAEVLEGWLRKYLAVINQQAGLDTRNATGILTLAVQEAAKAAQNARSYRELRVPVVRQAGVRYGRLDVVIWQPQYPDIVVEIDSAPNRESVRKLEFARDAGALALWVRHGSGDITAPEGVAVIDLR